MDISVVRATVSFCGEPVFRLVVSQCSGRGEPPWWPAPVPAWWLFELAEVFAHGVVAGQDGGVSVRGDRVDNGVSQDNSWHRLPGGIARAY